MRLGSAVVRFLNVAVATFFAGVGLRLMLVPALGEPGVVDLGGTPQKVVLGLVFLLAALPMFYYAFTKRPGSGARKPAGSPETGNAPEPHTERQP